MLKIFEKENSSTLCTRTELKLCTYQDHSWNNADISLVKVYYKFNRNKPLFNDILNTF